MFVCAIGGCVSVMSSLCVMMCLCAYPLHQGLASRQELLRFARLHDFDHPEVRCDVGSPLKRLEQLVGMEPSAYSLPAAAEIPAPVWDEHKFRAGRLSHSVHLQFWDEVVLVGHPQRERILDAMRGMRPQRYFKRYRGRFAGVNYDCDEPPARVFRNNLSRSDLTSTGETCMAWAQRKISADVATGALLRLGRVGQCPTPRVVLPLSVEPLKPRLIHDARYTNLWCEPNPFSMDRVGSVPDTFERKSVLGSYDHKSGYHAFLFAEDAREFFGFELDGYYYVPRGGIFGWNVIPEIYHIAHEALLAYAARVFGIPSLVYLDDALTGSRTAGGMAEAGYALEVCLWLNFLAGYTISVPKSVLGPVPQICWLGIDIDTDAGTFSIPPLKKAKFVALVDAALASGYITVSGLESVAGKAISFMLAVGEAAKVFTREMFNVLASVRTGRTGHNSAVLRLSPRLRRVLEVWTRFIDAFDGAPWLDVMHSVLRIETDASSRRWGGVLMESGQAVIEVGEEFSPSEMELHIEAKEALAVTRVIEELAAQRGWQFLAGRRVDAWIDNLPLVFAMNKGSSRMAAVHTEVERLFWLKLEHHFVINAIWWDTHQNFRADGITRTPVDGDWRLGAHGFRVVWDEWGPFAADLMASSVSAQRDPRCGTRLAFFSQYCSPGSAGVNLLAQALAPGSYFCFPPVKMVGPVVTYLAGAGPGVRVALLVDAASARGSGGWFPRVSAIARGSVRLPVGCVRDHGGTVVPSCFVCYWIESGERKALLRDRRV